MRCSHCNMENLSDSRFCGNCGRPLETEDFGASGGNGQTQEGRVEERKPVKRTGKRIWVVTAGVVLILAAAVAVFLILGSRRDAKEMEDLLAKGDQYLEELDYKEAEDQYLESISIDPKKEEPYLRLAEIYVQQNQPQKAVKILEEGRKNTESDMIREKYTLYSYVDEVLIPEKGECQEGEYLCKYNYTKNYMGLESVHSQKGVLTSRIRDFDGDGAEELLVLLLVNGEELDDEGLQYVSEGELVN
ncbi:MAG TPA: tetratricopeptide repeat protein, partial [Candidatus Dorea gallistercoris]|nr:tetratricopeptide repeat protein [Candidatus Dorea gallistercoris]